MQNFSLEVKRIDTEIKDLTWMGELFKFEFFRTVYNEPVHYIEIVKSSLIDNNISAQQKIIIVLMMQKLPLGDYLSFFENLFQMLEKGQITFEIFKWAVFPGYEWNTALAENFQVKQVRAIISKFIESKNIDEKLKRYFREELLTGRAKQQVEFLRDVGQIT